MGGAISVSSTHAVKKKPSVVGYEIVKGGIAVKGRIFKKSITDDYVFSSKVVGTGFSGPVRLATHKQTGKECAVKRYDKNAADLERIEYLKSEAEVYLRLDHPNICKLFAIYEDERNVWIVMEYCAGEELYQRLHERKVYSEHDAAEVSRQMVEAVHYLHSHYVVHRDLKLENWLYEKSDQDDGGRLKLIDFGFSKIWHPNKSKTMVASCGSLTYVSPDTLSGSYTNACDMWSLGVTVYFLLVGVPPFFGTEKVIVDRILRGAYSMDGCRWARISEEGKDFVRKLLVIDPVERMSSREALNHVRYEPWIVSSQTKSSSNQPLEESVLHSLRQFALASHMKRAALTMMAYCLTTKDIEELTTLFRQFDRNQDGCLRMEDFMDVMKNNFNISNTEIENLFNGVASMPISDGPENEVCYSDFIAALLQTRLRFHEDVIREAFLKFDADRSGYITPDDLRQVIGDKFEGVDVDEVVRDADINGDGRIDYEEFLAAVLAEAQADEVISPVATPATALTKLEKAELECNRSWLAEKIRGNERAEKKRRFLRQLLGVVDSNLATRQSNGGLEMMTSSRSSPHIIGDIFGDFSSDPRTPHARPWDSRIESIFDEGLAPLELAGSLFHNCNATKEDTSSRVILKGSRWNSEKSHEDVPFSSLGGTRVVPDTRNGTDYLVKSVRERLMAESCDRPIDYPEMSTWARKLHGTLPFTEDSFLHPEGSRLQIHVNKMLCGEQIAQESPDDFMYPYCDVRRRYTAPAEDISRWRGRRREATGFDSPTALGTTTTTTTTTTELHAFENHHDHQSPSSTNPHLRLLGSDVSQLSPSDAGVTSKGTIAFSHNSSHLSTMDGPVLPTPTSKQFPPGPGPALAVSLSPLACTQLQDPQVIVVDHVHRTGCTEHHRLAQMQQETLSEQSGPSTLYFDFDLII